MSAQLIDNLMEKIHVLTQENKRLKDENKTKTETIERLGSQIADGRSTGLEVTDHGTTNTDAGVCGADRVVGLLRGQDGAEPVA
jgi:hypothetical protein